MRGTGRLVTAGGCRIHRDGAPASALLRGELLKTVTTRTLPGFAIACTAFAVLNVILVSEASGLLRQVPEKQEALSGLPVLLLLWGLVGTAGEYRHRTAAPAALVARPGRAGLLLYRISAYALTALATGVLTMTVSVALGLPLLAHQPGPALSAADVAGSVCGNLVAFVLAAILGAALGALIRSPVVGVVAVLVLTTAVELLSNVQESAANLTPFGAADVLSGMTHNTTISAPAAGLVLAAWAALAAAAAMLGERRRDLA